jgi:hypothetical protein
VEYGVCSAHLTTSSIFSLEQEEYKSRRLTYNGEPSFLELIVVDDNNGCINAFLLLYINFNGFNGFEN